MIHKYIRFSTDAQDEQQQQNTINGYLERNNLKADNEIRDEGVSGGVSYKKRNLAKLISKLSSGDTLIVSELSRLTRGGIGELSEMIEQHFKPNQIRLVIVNVGLDIDCTSISAMTELQLAMMASFAKIEKEHIKQRTKSALEARKKTIKKDGGFVSKRGVWTTKLGNPQWTTELVSKAGSVSGTRKRKDALDNPQNRIVWEIVKDVNPSDNNAVDRAVTMLNNAGILTPKGHSYDRIRLRSRIQSMKRTRGKNYSEKELINILY
ncbi:MAG: recombinase family protein, partial [Bacteroidaceae bacterium]|nr:recombinase family protein [Bacteroidaceae bacterium]